MAEMPDVRRCPVCGIAMRKEGKLTFFCVNKKCPVGTVAFQYVSFSTDLSTKENLMKVRGILK